MTMIATPTGRSLFGGAFSPLQLPGLKLWLDASQITGLVDGDPVATWSDLSGNGNHATQATGSKKPTYKVNIVNGRPVVRFDGVDDYVTLGTVFGRPASYSVILVASVADVTRGQYIGGSEDATGATAKTWGITFVKDTNSGDFDYSFGNDTVSKVGVSAAGTLVNGTPFILSKTYAAGATEAIAKNGTTLSMTTSGTAVANSGVASEYAIGRGGAFNGNYFGGDVLAYILCTQAISDADRRSVERYYGSRAGIAVA